jgi:putative acetyltransferase
VALESPRQPDVRRLVDALDAEMTLLYPPESTHLMDIEALCSPAVRFLVARLDGDAVGCGALRHDAAGYGEVKRMYVRPGARGRHVGRVILERIEREARAAGLAYLRLEAGHRQPVALGLYRSAGFRERGPFGDYPADPLSVFLEKDLQDSSRAPTTLGNGQAASP